MIDREQVLIERIGEERCLEITRSIIANGRDIFLLKTASVDECEFAQKVANDMLDAIDEVEMEEEVD